MSNITRVRDQIDQKKRDLPHRATITTVTGSLTDYDTFPYPRYYRGNPSSDVPIVAERETGWRPRHDTCYSVINPPDMEKYPLYPNNCFQTACSTVFPCYPEYAARYSEIEARNLVLDKKCITQYR